MGHCLTCVLFVDRYGSCGHAAALVHACACLRSSRSYCTVAWLHRRCLSYIMRLCGHAVISLLLVLVVVAVQRGHLMVVVAYGDGYPSTRRLPKGGRTLEPQYKARVCHRVALVTEAVGCRSYVARDACRQADQSLTRVCIAAGREFS